MLLRKASIARGHAYNCPSVNLVTLNYMTKHDDVIKWKHLRTCWPFVWGIHRWPVDSPHKGQLRLALTFSLMYAWTNDRANSRNAGDLRHHRAHYDVTKDPRHNSWNVMYHNKNYHQFRCFIVKKQKKLHDHESAKQLSAKMKNKNSNKNWLAISVPINMLLMKAGFVARLSPKAAQFSVETCSATG